jgi:hypothetical protein
MSLKLQELHWICKARGPKKSAKNGEQLLYVVENTYRKNVALLV